MPAPSSRDCPVYGLLYVNKPLTVQVSYVCCTGVRACHRRDFLSSKNSLRSCGYRLVNPLRRCSSSRNQISERVIVDEIRVKPLKYTGQVLYEQFENPQQCDIILVKFCYRRPEYHLCWPFTKDGTCCPRPVQNSLSVSPFVE